MKQRKGDTTALVRRRDEEIFRAYRLGSSLRAIAEVTGLSHQTVSVIIKKVEEG